MVEAGETAPGSSRRGKGSTTNDKSIRRYAPGPFRPRGSAIKPLASVNHWGGILKTLIRTAAVLLSTATSILCTTSSGIAETRAGITGSTTESVELATSFSFEAEEGAHPVSGRSGTWTAPDYEIMVWENENLLKIDAADWNDGDFIRVELNAPSLVPLTTGDYLGARERDIASGNPGMLVVSNGLGCVDVYGEFHIERLERDAAGTLVGLDADFSQSCGAPNGPLLNGRIHYQP